MEGKITLRLMVAKVRSWTLVALIAAVSPAGAETLRVTVPVNGAMAVRLRVDVATLDGTPMTLWGFRNIANLVGP